MGRTRNETAYAVLVEELRVVTERVVDCDVYIHRPCVQVYGEEQPFSSSYRRGSTNHQYWHLSHWVVVVDVHLAVQYAALSGVTPLMRYSHYQLCTDLHHRQAISWEYKDPTKVTTAWDRTTQRHLFTHRLYDTVADLRRSDEVEFTESIEGLWRIDAQIHGLVATSANYEGERGRLIDAHVTLTEECRTCMKSLSAFDHEEDRVDVHNEAQGDAMRRARTGISEEKAFRCTQALGELMSLDIDCVKGAVEWIAKLADRVGRRLIYQEAEEERQRTGNAF